MVEVGQDISVVAEVSEILAVVVLCIFATPVSVAVAVGAEVVMTERIRVGNPGGSVLYWPPCLV